MNKKDLTEADIRTKFITPAIVGEGGSKWNVMTQVLEEHYFTRGRVIVRGKTTTRGEAKKADYILFYKPNIPLAVVEAKDNNHSVGAGMQQALEYAAILDVPFAYSSNGDAFLEHDRTATSGTVTREIPLDQFPTPEELWTRYRASRGYTPEQESVATQDYYDGGSQKRPRYYQLIAINRTVEAIARGEKRILLVMATGTGKTYTAFQIIWRLWKSKAKKRILFLVDRNILADQTKTNDFKPFGQAMTKITNRTVDKAYEIYLSLYQAVTGTEEEQNIYKQFSPDFFDLVIVDECHRGSAADDAAWRKVLEYFSSATQIGLTATPKETKEVSNIEYFGDPIYTYSLRQGISDGFLAPYKVVRIGLDKDLDGWRPEDGQTDRYGQLIEDREYNDRDYDRNLILEQRTATVAAKVTEFLRGTNRFAKTIVFCENVDHAERMRQALVNANPDLAAANAKYVMRITGDNDEGKAQLDNFIDPESTYPVIACTSRLMSTGVDAQTCHLIVLDRRINSMTEFKQIIGRGTRLYDGKDYFTIYDFVKAHHHFSDPEWDGDPIEPEPKEPKPAPPPPGPVPPGPDPEPRPPRPAKIKVKLADGKERAIQHMMCTTFWHSDGTPMSAQQFMELLFGALPEFFRDEAELRALWSVPATRKKLLEGLAEKGFGGEQLAEMQKIIDAEKSDLFDVLAHVAYALPPVTREERAARAKPDISAHFNSKQQVFLDFVLSHYVSVGVEELDQEKITPLLHLKYHGSIADALADLGRPDEIGRVFVGFQKYLYQRQAAA